jgi:hypothetical protein
LYSYDEFTIEVRRGQEGRHGHRVTVQATRPDGGETGSTDAEPSTTSVARLLTGESAPQRVSLGNALGECLFPPRVLEAFQRTLSRLGPDIGVRVRLRCLDEEMERWPWELARIETPFQEDESRYLFRNTRFSLVRVPVSAEPVYQPKDRRNLVILTVDATEVVQGRKLIPDFPAELDITGPVRVNVPRPTPRSIDEEIDRFVSGDDPLDIFHFTGHGRPPSGGLPGALVVYRDEEDTAAQYYSGDLLAERLGRAGTSLAFVNACYTDQPEAGGAPGIAQALTGVVPVVLAVRGEVDDWVARDFAAVFYHWLLRGSTVDEAVARGRRRLDESLSDWDRVVLYSRAHRGRFLEPATPADAQVLARTPSTPVRGPAGDGIRRWAVVAGAGGHWQLVPGEAGPELRRADSETAADISHLRGIPASLALSSDAQVVAQLSRGQLTLAWMDRVGLRLDPWPAQVSLPLDDQETRLLAVAVDYGDEVICVLSSDQVTYRAEVSPAGEPAMTELFDSPTRCAAIAEGNILTVDGEGRLRDRMMNLSSRGIAEVTSLDAARSAGKVSYVLAGLDHAGRPVVAEGSSIEALSVMAVQADEVAVVRPLSPAHAPDQALLAFGGQLERLPVGDAP